MSGTSDRDEHTILVVEDNALLALDAASSAAAAGFDVVMTARGGEALAMLDNRRFRAAILDFEVTDGTTLKLVDKLTHVHIPYCIVSGLPRHHIESQGVPARAIRSKPMSYDQVVDELLASMQVM